MKWLLIILAGAVAIVAVAVIIGVMLPQRHVASRQIRIDAPPDVVWRLITNVEGFPAWRPSLKRVERLPDRDGRAQWIEEGSSGRMTLAVEQSEAPRRLVTRIMDRDLPFGGSWTFELAPEGGGTRLTVTEDGEIYNPVFRFVARFILGYEATMAEYVEALRRRAETGQHDGL